MTKVEEKVIKPTIEGLKKDKVDYKGFIFFGLMNVKGEPFVIEYNCRLGDPETEVIIPRINNDIVELFVAMGKGELDKIKMDIDERFSTTVMLVSGGYPESYQKGKRISKIDDVVDVYPFHAGTSFDDKGNIITSGGRVMAMSALGESVNEALEKSNNAANTIEFDKKYYRSDIGFDLLKLSF
jgi:phosphoribosylamine--glycine ligase